MQDRKLDEQRNNSRVAGDAAKDLAQLRHENAQLTEFIQQRVCGLCMRARLMAAQEKLLRDSADAIERGNEDARRLADVKRDAVWLHVAALLLSESQPGEHQRAAAAPGEGPDRRQPAHAPAAQGQGGCHHSSR